MFGSTPCFDESHPQASDPPLDNYVVANFFYKTLYKHKYKYMYKLKYKVNETSTSTSTM